MIAISFLCGSAFPRCFFNRETGLKAPNWSIKAKACSVIICVLGNYLLDNRADGTVWLYRLHVAMWLYFWGVSICIEQFS